MAEVIVELRILPSDVEINLDLLEQEIRSAISPQRISREPIAFGLIAFKVTKVVEDKAGEIERIESRLREIKGIGQIEVTGITRGL